MHTCPPKNLFQTARVILSCQIIPLLCSKPGCHLTQRESPGPDKGQASLGPKHLSDFIIHLHHTSFHPLASLLFLLPTEHTPPQGLSPCWPLSYTTSPPNTDYLRLTHFPEFHVQLNRAFSDHPSNRYTEYRTIMNPKSSSIFQSFVKTT